MMKGRPMQRIGTRGSLILTSSSVEEETLRKSWTTLSYVLSTSQSIRSCHHYTQLLHTALLWHSSRPGRRGWLGHSGFACSLAFLFGFNRIGPVSGIGYWEFCFSSVLAL